MSNNGKSEDARYLFAVEFIASGIIQRLMERGFEGDGLKQAYESAIQDLLEKPSELRDLMDQRPDLTETAEAASNNEDESGQGVPDDGPAIDPDLLAWAIERAKQAY